MMPVFIAIKPNLHLSDTFLREVLLDWGISGKYGDISGKPELVQAIEGEFPENLKPAYLKIYIFRSEKFLYALNGSMPTEKAENEPQGLTAFLNALERDPAKLPEFSNDFDNFTCSDPKINEKIKLIKEGSLKPENFLPRLQEVKKWLKAIENQNFKPNFSSISQDTGKMSQETSLNRTETSLAQSEMSNRVDNIQKMAPTGPENVEKMSSTGPVRIQSCEKSDCVAQPPMTFMPNITKLIRIPVFDESKSDVVDWLATARYAYDLARVTDEPAICAALLCHLPQNLSQRVRSALERCQPDPSKVTVANLESVLKELTKKSSHELERELKNIKFDSAKKFRDLYLAIELKVQRLNPAIKDDKALEHLCTREFRGKCPSHVRDNVSFKTSTLEGLELADLAESVFEVTKSNTSANALHTKRSDSNRGGAKGYRGGSRGGFRGGSRGGHKPRGDQQKRPSEPDLSRRFKAQLICYFCDEPGHGIDQCPKLKEKRKVAREAREARKGRRGPDDRTDPK